MMGDDSNNAVSEDKNKESPEIAIDAPSTQVNDTQNQTQSHSTEDNLAKAIMEYRNILDEKDEMFLKDKMDIMKLYQPRLEELENYEKMRNEMTKKEHLCRVQSLNNTIESNDK